MTRRRGLFITFEGIDGCGKSTQAVRLCRLLESCGFSVSLVREPGGTALSEKIRHLLLDRRQEIDPTAELFLYEAARAQLTENVIAPALARGEIVVCDRYYDSTTAYQGYGRGLDLNLIKRLNRAASLPGKAGPPDLTLVLDVDYRTSLSRRRGRPDRLERSGRAFFERVRRGFKSLAREKRVVLLDGRREIDFVFRQVVSHVLPLIRRSRRRLV